MPTPHEQFKKLPIAPHHDVRETFADQLCLAMFDGNLRMEFAVARINELKPAAQPTGERHIVCRLVLSTECAIDLINQMQNFAIQFAKAGLIKMDKPPSPVEPTGKAN